jgi:hypothetical protein
VHRAAVSSTPLERQPGRPRAPPLSTKAVMGVFIVLNISQGHKRSLG